jgi:hypothetical protein
MIKNNSLIDTIERLTGLDDLSERSLALYYSDGLDMFQWSTVKLDPIEYDLIKRCTNKVKEWNFCKVINITITAAKIKKYNEESDKWVI